MTENDTDVLLTTPVVKLKVFAHEDEEQDSVYFALGKKMLPPNWELRGNTLKCPPGSSATLEFRLKDRTDQDLEFDREDPFGSVVGPICPADDAPPCAGFSVQSVSETVLQVSYTATEDEYAYVLRFVGDEGNAVFDPIIINRGF